MVTATERSYKREERDSRAGDALLALAIAGAFALQHCYDPSKAVPVDPGYPPPVDIRTADGGRDGSR
jgi:hypothetical protein